MNEWLDDAAARVASVAGGDPAEYTLSETETELLLGLARDVAHKSGDRRNAPLATYLAGLARGRPPGLALGEAVDALRPRELP